MAQDRNKHVICHPFVVHQRRDVLCLVVMMCCVLCRVWSRAVLVCAPEDRGGIGHVTAIGQKTKANVIGTVCKLGMK